MHKQVSALLSKGGSARKLAAFGKALGNAGLDIQQIGGAEWLHDGPVTLILSVDEETHRRKFERICERLEVPWLSFVMVAVELDDAPGSLGAAADVLGDINIYSVAVLGKHGNKAIVGLGIRPTQADQVVTLLTNADYVAERRRHEPDDGTEWDDRTEELLPLWEIEGASKNDPRFWQPPSPSEGA